MPQAYSFGGASIFGRSAMAHTEPNERAVQVNEFFGLDGVEELDGGSRGGHTTVTGLIVGSTLADFNTAWDTAVGYQDGIARVLATSQGTFPQVKLASWSPTSKLTGIGGGTTLMSYRAVFRHMV